MEVDGKLRESKLKTVSVGGLAAPDGKILHGFRGCIQVSLVGRVQSLYFLLTLVCIRFKQTPLAAQYCLLSDWLHSAAGPPYRRGSQFVSGEEGERGAGLQRARPLQLQPLSC